VTGPVGRGSAERLSNLGPFAASVERDSWLRAVMLVTIPGLLALILVTPSLLGRQPELASLPILVIGMTQDKATFVLDVSGAIQAYLYANITLAVTGIADPSFSDTGWELDTYNVHLRVAAAEAPFLVWAYLEDQQGNYFEYNVTVRFGLDEEDRPAMFFTFPDEPTLDEQRRIPPDDFRVAVPLRGSS